MKTGKSWEYRVLAKPLELPTTWLQLVEYAEEANIGHAVIARAIFVGLEQAVREMKSLLNDPALRP